jgi:serine/threonine protein kinase
MVAVKRLKQSALTNKGKKDFAREVAVMAGLHHGSLLRLLAYCNEGNERILVYAYMKNKSLDNHIFGIHPVLSEFSLLSYITDLIINSP